MADRDVEVIGIIIGDRLPVERARADPDLLQRLELGEAIGLDLILVRRHDLGDRRQPRLERDEQKAPPIFEGDGRQTQLLRLQFRIFLPMRHSDQPPVAGIAPRVIGAGQHLVATRAAVDHA